MGCDAMGCDAMRCEVGLRGKTRSYLLNGTRGTRLALRHLILFGGTFAAPQADVVMERVAMVHPSANRRVLGEAGATAAPTVLDFNKVSRDLA